MWLRLQGELMGLHQLMGMEIREISDYKGALWGLLRAVLEV